MNNHPLQLSVCIVTYQAHAYLRQCLDTFLKEIGNVSHEIIVVDNGSRDGTLEMLSNDYPQVFVLQNDANEGFTRPINKAMRQSSGQFVALLNPDTITLPGAFQNLIQFMQENPGVGICGPKVLNEDRTLQGPCRRGEPRPLAMIGYFFRLGRLFPMNERLNEYLLSYLDENENHAVAGVAGSCMLVRRAVIDRIGYLDERFFAYQEDADYCRRARDDGWLVYYVPSAQIIHFGGRGGSRVKPWRSIVEWHLSYFRYYRKHLAKDYWFLFNWLYYGIIAAKLTYAMLANLLRRQRFAGPRR